MFEEQAEGGDGEEGGEGEEADLTLDEWLVSDDAEDLNEDGEIDEADFVLFEEEAEDDEGEEGDGEGEGEEDELTLDEWLVSDDAEDLNEDGEIDEADFVLFEEEAEDDEGEEGDGEGEGEEDELTLDEWLVSDDAEDLNEDGEIDEADFALFEEEEEEGEEGEDEEGEQGQEGEQGEVEEGQEGDGRLQAIDLEALLLTIDGQDLPLAEGVEIVNREGDPVRLSQLLELVDGRPKVEFELNVAGEIVRLEIRIRERGDREDARKDLGPKKREQIVGNLVFVDPSTGRVEIKGDVFAITSRTIIEDADKDDLTVAALIDLVESAQAIDQVELARIDFRPQSEGLPVTTRIRLVDASRASPRRGVSVQSRTVGSVV